MGYEGLLAETVRLRTADGEQIDAYSARPLGPGPYPAVVVIHHAPGLDEEMQEVVRRLAAHGYVALCPDLYTRQARGIGREAAAKSIRGKGDGLPDQQMLGDVETALAELRSAPYNSGRIGIVGFCAGGRQAYLAACRMTFDAAVDCYGGSVVAGPEKLTAGRPVAPIDFTGSLSCPVLGVFGSEDPHVPAEHIAAIDERAKAHGKHFEYDMYQAGHAFLGHYHHAYRVEPARQAWERIFEFLNRYLVEQ